MRILMVAPYPYPGKPIRGGVETVTYSLIEGFKDMNGVELKIISYCQDHDEVINISSNVTCQFLRNQFPSKKMELKRHIKGIILQLNKDWNPDIIHIQGNGSNFLLYDDKIKDKFVITQHGIIWNEMMQTKSLRPKINMLLAYFIEWKRKKFIKNWIFISEYNKKHNKKFLSNNNIYHSQIYNPVNPKFFQQNEPKRHEGLNLLFVGRIVPRKGLKDLLVGLSRINMPDIRLHVVGGFEVEAYQNEIESEIDRLGITDRITMHGWKNADEILKLYEDVDVLVLPSYQETLPCVIAEAMAQGKIVVATNVGGIDEMIDDGKNGYLYSAGDIEGLSKVLKTLNELSEEEKKGMSEYSKKKALRLYSPTEIAQSHIKFYKTILDRI